MLKREQWYDIFILTLFPCKIQIRGMKRADIFWIPINKNDTMDKILKIIFNNYIQLCTWFNLYKAGKSDKMKFKFRNFFQILF